MTYSGTERQSGYSNGKNESSIMSSNFGGLNKIASDINLPYEDSPALNNCDIDVAGNITKRKGTRIVHWQKTPVSVTGNSLIPFTTGLGYNMVIQKQGMDILIHEFINDVSTLLVTKSGVWDAEGALVRVNYVSTNEPEPRLIMCTGVNVPIELKFVEQQEVLTGTASTTATIQNASRYALATPTTLLLYRNRMRVTGFTLSYNAGTEVLTISGLTAYTGSTTFDLVMPVWGWFTEAYFYYGDRFVKTTTRFNISATDQFVEIPEKLRDGVVDMSPTFPGVYPIYAWDGTKYAGAYPLATNRELPSWFDYAHGDGSRYVYTAGEKLNPAPLFITFGKIPGAICNAAGEMPGSGTVACQPLPVTMLRSRSTPFNGGNGLPGQYINVMVDGVVVPQNTNATVANATYGSYYLLNKDLSTVVTSTATDSYGLGFYAASVVGVPSTAKIVIYSDYCGVAKFCVGANSNDSINSYVDGHLVPIYGLGDYANYYSGSFPTNVLIYQGRLVFAGFPEQSLTIVFSNVYDTIDPGKNFNSFQSDAFATGPADPFDMSLSSTPEDLIRGAIVWQNFLFVLTRKAAFKVFGGNQPLSLTSKFSTLVSNIGLVNSYCIVKTDKSISYLSDTGVYDLITTADSVNEFQANEKSIKIRSLFGITTLPVYENLPWMSFDRNTNKIYLGYPAKNVFFTTYFLYVYNTYRESWTEYSTPSGFNLYCGTPYVDRQNGYGFCAAGNLYRASTPNTPTPLDYTIIRFEYEPRFMDYCQRFTGTGSAQALDVRQYAQASVVTTNKVQEYSLNRVDTKKPYGYQPIPISDVADILVYLETTPTSSVYQVLTQGVDYFKRPNGNIYLTFNPGTGRDLLMSPRMPITDSVYGADLYTGAFDTRQIEDYLIFIDNVVSWAFTYGLSGGRVTLNLTAPNASVIEVGNPYHCYYFSPVFNQQALSKTKRMKYVYAYFNNALALPKFLADDVNTASSQPVETIVGESKQRLNANISIKYDSESGATTSYDTFGFDNVAWDDYFFDVPTPNFSFEQTGLFKESFQGTGYSYQLIVWNFDETAFVLAGYQIEVTMKGSKGNNWSK